MKDAGWSLVKWITFLSLRVVSLSWYTHHLPLNSHPSIRPLTHTHLTPHQATPIHTPTHPSIDDGLHKQELFALLSCTKHTCYKLLKSCNIGCLLTPGQPWCWRTGRRSVSTCCLHTYQRGLECPGSSWPLTPPLPPPPRPEGRVCCPPEDSSACRLCDDISWNIRHKVTTWNNNEHEQPKGLLFLRITIGHSKLWNWAWKS